MSHKYKIYFVPGNKLHCDCRLSWIQVLRNETKSEPLRMALDEVTCAYVTDESTTNEKDKSNNNENMFEIETNSDVIQQDSNDDVYGETKPSYKYEETIKSLENQVTLVDIPAQALPCPGKLVQNGEDSLMLSSKEENYWLSNSSLKILSNLWLVLTLTITTVFY